MTEVWNPRGREIIVAGYMRVVCLDGPRKGREYYFPLGKTEFGITSPVPGDARAVLEGGRVSGYGQYIYNVRAVWGMSAMTRNFGAFFERLAYQ